MNPRNLIDDFAGAEKIYLNNASVSLLPTVSIKAMTDFLVTYNRAGPDSMYADSYVTGNLRSTRKVISEMIGCRPEEIALTQSTTDGINMVASGIKLPPHSNIILRGAAHEHHANYYPWLNLSKRAGIKSLEIDDNGFFDMRQLKSAIDSNTRLVALSHALYNTGAILPIQEVGEILGKENIPFFVDAAQTVGCAGSFDVGALGCNFMSFNGSKWLCGPMGTGLFYCRRDSGGLLEPTQIGYESAMIYDGDQLAFKDAPDRFQAGFRNYVGMVGLEASARYLLEHGLQNIRRRIIVLADQLRDGLAEIPGVTLYGPAEQERRTSIVSFTVAGHNPKQIVERMEMRGIVLAERESLDKKMVRASPHLFNTEDDIQTVIRAIRDL
jgi:cysteine desulfurase/selenocysteine lyase